MPSISEVTSILGVCFEASIIEHISITLITSIIYDTSDIKILKDIAVLGY